MKKNIVFFYVYNKTQKFRVPNSLGALESFVWVCSFTTKLQNYNQVPTLLLTQQDVLFVNVVVPQQQQQKKKVLRPRPDAIQPILKSIDSRLRGKVTPDGITLSVQGQVHHLIEVKKKFFLNCRFLFFFLQMIRKFWVFQFFFSFGEMKTFVVVIKKNNNNNNNNNNKKQSATDPDNLSKMYCGWMAWL